MFSDYARKQVAKVLLFSDMCKKKVHFCDKKVFFVHFRNKSEPKQGFEETKKLPA